MSRKLVISIIGVIAIIFPAVVAGAAPAAEQTWTRVPVVDSQCLAKVQSHPDSHTRQCAIQCAKGGYGLIAEDGTYLKFDPKGNEKTLAALKAATKPDHLRATVTGTRNGETIDVSSISLE